MLEFQVGSMIWKISVLFFVIMLYVLYADPTGVAAFSFFAAVVHECGHLMTACCLKQYPKMITVSCYGICLSTRSDFNTSTLNDVLIALAGPLVNIANGILCQLLSLPPIYAHIHYLIAVINLLPIIPLDGGRAFRAALIRFTNGVQAEKIENIVFYGVWTPLAVLGIQLVFHSSHNFSLLIVAIYVIFLKLFYNGN